MAITASQRLINLLKLDRKDITQVFFYAIFAGLVSLSLPLGIQAIINLVKLLLFRILIIFIIKICPSEINHNSTLRKQ